MAEPQEPVPRARLDALTDGVFAFAMTLLVINVELPDDFDPTTTGALLDALLGLQDTLLAYVITFLVLGGFWLNRARATKEPEEAGNAYAWAVLTHLFFVTLMPFSMVVVGRFDLAPAVWVYSANMILLGLSAAWIGATARRDVTAKRAASDYIEVGLLVVSALLAMVVALFSPDYAMLAYALNLGAPLLRRWFPAQT